MNNDNRAERILWLDYLRGLAALSVVLFHFTYGYDSGMHLLADHKVYFTYGSLGVHLFFIISGFVILMTLENTKSSLDFFVSRFSRLYPAYWAAIFISLIFITVFNGLPDAGKISIGQLAMNITMLQHWFKVKDIDGAYWTLSVELTFYFLIWVLFYFKQLNRIEVFSLFWLLLSLLNEAIDIPFKNILQQLFILPYAPMFVAGMVFYNIKSKDGYNLSRSFLLLFSLGIEAFILCKLYGAIWPAIIIGIFYLVFSGLIGGFIFFKKDRMLLFFGNISYSLYLIHEKIGTIIIYYLRKVTDVEWLYVLIPLMIVIGIAYLLNIYVERPAMTFIRRSYRKYVSANSPYVQSQSI